MPSELYITEFKAEYPTATNNDNSGDQHTEYHARAVESPHWAIDHVYSPSGLYAIIFPIAFPPTATNKDNSGDQHTEYQIVSSWPPETGIHPDVPVELNITELCAKL